MIRLDQQAIHEKIVSADEDTITDYIIKIDAIELLVHNFDSIPDKYAAWNDLIGLMYNKDLWIKSLAAEGLSLSFKYLPYKFKSTAWEDIHILSKDDDSYVRRYAGPILGGTFRYITDELKQSAWNDLHRLTTDKNEDVRGRTPRALAIVLEYKVFTSFAWDDLCRLINDKDYYVKMNIIYALGYAFPFIPEECKLTVWNYIHQMKSDKDKNLRMHANYSLGNIYIYKASKSENESNARSQLEKAIVYFKNAAELDVWLNPARFCYPFYCSFDAIFLKKINSIQEINRFIEAAKEQIGLSECNEKLIEAIEQLAGILEMAHNAKESGIGYQEVLTRCSDIFKQVEQLMNENRKDIHSIYELYKTFKPSFDKRITDLINEVKETATTAYEEAKGTPAEDVVYSIKREIQSWSIEDSIRMNKKIDRLYSILKEKVPDIPENRILINEIGDIKKTMVIGDQLEIITLLMMSLPNASFPKMIDDLKENMNNRFDGVNEKVDKNNETASDTNVKVTRTENKVDLLLFIELKDIASKLKEEGNDKGSQDVNDIADKIKVLFENKDPKEITFFIEKIQKEVPDICEEIEKSTAPKDVKEKAKKGLKENIMKFGRDISTGVATNWIAAYLPSILGAGASGLLVPGIILAALLSIDNLRDKK